MHPPIFYGVGSFDEISRGNKRGKFEIESKKLHTMPWCVKLVNMLRVTGLIFPIVLKIFYWSFDI